MKERLGPRAAVCVLIIAMLLGACSNNASSNNEGENNAAVNPAAEAGDEGFPRTVASAGGKQVTIEAVPKKVALVHWGLIQHLLFFDIPSIAVTLPFTKQQSELESAPIKPYTDQFDEVVVVGENTAPNLEALLQYAPDLIIAGTVTNEKVADELGKIAPTVFLDETSTDVWNDWQGVMTTFGGILGQEDAAKQAIEQYTAKIDEAKAKLAQVEGTVAYLQVRENTAWLQGTQYAGHFYDPLGLQAPEQAVGEGAELTLEGLAAIDPDHLFLGYFNYEDTSLPAHTNEWEKSEVWKTLKAVKQNQVYKINGALAFGYGPISRSYGVDAVVEALSK